MMAMGNDAISRSDGEAFARDGGVNLPLHGSATCRSAEMQARKVAEQRELAKALDHFGASVWAKSEDCSIASRPEPICTRPVRVEHPDMLVSTMRDVSARDGAQLMDVALFRLSKRKKRIGDVIRHQLRDGYVEIKAGADGMATIWDYDLVLILVSHLTWAMNRYHQGVGGKPGRIFWLQTAEILRFCRKGDGTRQFVEVEAALDRLKGTTIKSVREKRVKKGSHVFREKLDIKSEGLINSYEVICRTNGGNAASIKIEVPDWIYREVAEAAKPEVLTVHPDYFLIEPGIGRFIYRLARRAAGASDAVWAFQTIYERSGSAGTFKEFCRILRKIISVDNLPEYSLLEEVGQSGPKLLMKRRSTARAELGGG